MRRRSFSLRARLFALIISPLVVMAIVLGFWRFSAAQKTAEELFDRSLLSAALAISRDVVLNTGDALSPSTRDLIGDASGGEVFYHVTGPSGIYVTGYAYPPFIERTEIADPYAPQYFEALYREENVRILSITEHVTIDSTSGDAIVLVWQRMSERREFAIQLAARAAILVIGLIGTVALVIWFGVQRGLRPLIDLENAIATRSPDDLSEIKRSVPVEVKGVVSTLNQLFKRVEKNLDAHQTFISDAAHQLRNPAAAVQSMAEAVRDAKESVDRDKRINELVAAARRSARVAEQLLSLDRLQQSLPRKTERFDLQNAVEEICTEFAPSILSRDLDFEFVSNNSPCVVVEGDPTFIGEAIRNLIDNSIKHGGENLSKISVQLEEKDGFHAITVFDDGKDLRPDQFEAAFTRFSQVEPSEGSGLGLAIVYSVADLHGGKVSINKVKVGASITLKLPKSFKNY